MTTEFDAARRAAVARGLQLAGRGGQAISAYEDVLAAVPGYHVARREIGLISAERGDDVRAIAELAEYVRAIPLDVRAHHALIEALRRERGDQEPLRRYGLATSDARPLPDVDVCAMLVVRDEVDRLEFTLDYHSSIGVGAFVVIDNGSTDGTAELLAGRPDVHHWTTSGGYRASGAGYAWVAAVLTALGRDGWWMFIDADELLIYPPGDALSLPDLCRTLERESSGGLPALLVDCYPKGPLAASATRRGGDPRSVAPWFDRDWRLGARRRCFPVDDAYLLTKVPLVRWNPTVVIDAGAHVAHGIMLTETRRAALLHFKMLAGMAERSRGERARHDAIIVEHHEVYVRQFDGDPDLAVWDPSASVQYDGPEQLIDLGIIQ
jgi:Glycosyl transferase family 2